MESLVACPRDFCFGCVDGNDICHVCSGATPLDRENRWSDDGNCMCKRGFYFDGTLSSY